LSQRRSKLSLPNGVFIFEPFLKRRAALAVSIQMERKYLLDLFGKCFVDRHLRILHQYARSSRLALAKDLRRSYLRPI